MLKYSNLFLALYFFYVSVLPADQLTVELQTESAILINADTGAILFEKNSHVKQFPASTTKIATAIYALKLGSDQLDTMITADHDSVASIPEEKMKRSNYTLPAYWLIPGASHIGIKKGETLSLRDLLYGLMVASGDDAGNVIAKHLGGTIPKYMEGMNQYLKEIGCKETTFFNPHGLHHPQHTTTAYDMALLMRECLKNPTFREMISTVRCKRPKTNKQESVTLLQTNRLIRKGKFYYPKAIGGKTGHLSSGNSLVVAAQDGHRVLIAALLKCKERDDLFQDAIKLFDAAFQQPKVRRVLLKAGPQKFTLDLPGGLQPITTYVKDDIALEYYPAEEPKIKCLLCWNVSKPPISKDEQIGELRIQTPEGELLQTVPLLAQEEVTATWLWKIKNLLF